MVRHLLFCVCLLLLKLSAQAQHVYLYADDELRSFTDRINTLYGSAGDSIHTNTSLLNYWELSQLFKEAKSDIYDARLTQSDLYNLNKFLYTTSDYNYMSGNNPDFQAPSQDGTYGFYLGTNYLMEHVGAFHFMLQPQAQAYAYYGSDQELNFTTAAGLYMRGKVGNRFGFALSGTYHNDLLPAYYADYIQKHDAMPGVGKYQRSPISGYGPYQHVDYLLFNGHASYDLIPDHLAMSAGYSKFFIGDGIRSLIISDFTAPMPFLSFRTNFWKLEYTNLFLKADNQTFDYGNVGMGENKYIAIHYLSANLLPWLNVGLFETVISVKEGAPEVGYFNPMIMYRALERSLGSPDKMSIGLTGKIAIKKQAQLYGQVFLNEFILKELLANNGYIHNKWGVQLGAKYFNLFGISNLDIQAEANFIRPYAYQHRSAANFSTGNLPLAHPLGSGIKEYIFNVDYTPVPRFNIRGRLMHWQQGLDDSDTINYGSSVLKNINNAPENYGIGMTNGIQSQTWIAHLTGSYEFWPQLYLEAGAGFRKQSTQLTQGDQQNIFGFLGFRFYMSRKDLLQF